MPAKKITTACLRARKNSGERIIMLTAYDATFAKLLDDSGVDVLLVGDSLGMVIQGHQNTIPVTVEDIIYHTKCVARGPKRAHIMADMPFMSYQASIDHAMINAGRCLKEGGAESVKLEGGEELLETVSALTSSGIPVCAHIGLRPQTIHQMGGYKIQGKTSYSADKLISEAKMFEEAGAFMLLLEGIVAEIAFEITKSVNIPTVGISSGSGCDGQVLVIYDLLGMDKDFSPRYLKKYANLHEIVTGAVKNYINDVKEGEFPSEEHSFHRELQVIRSAKCNL
ncbi:MAG: 3-methyl-2-oxobutanoate hydroxymethyltransferase [Deltaproteobacteria bacterium]|nr:3-methyl-2-oxobutanoate hydroxymethyltransferase [Deltaproteobacteria bacterium]